MFSRVTIIAPGRTASCIFLCLYFLMVLPAASFSQRYNFTNLGVEEGLVQSQAIGLIQDNFGSLWVATLGGLSRYDGNGFSNYTQPDGLASNIIYQVLQARDGLICIATEDGVQ